MAFTLLALRLAELRGTLPAERIAELRGGIDELPGLAAAYLAEDAPVWAQTERIAAEVWEKEFFLYIGRHLGMPVCLEGALKLKEISYIPTDSYAAGEMKHGPIALLSEDTPVVAVMNDSHVTRRWLQRAGGARARRAGDRRDHRRQRGRSPITPTGRFRSRPPHPSSHPSSRRFRCRSWPTASPACAACRSTSRGIWPRPSPSSNRCPRNCGAAWRSCRSASSTKWAARCATSCSAGSRKTSTFSCAGTGSRSCSPFAAAMATPTSCALPGGSWVCVSGPTWGPRTGIEVVPPRRETPIAPGEPGFTGNPHTDFRIEPDPELPVRDDLERRDFTVNAIARDVRTRRLDRPLRRPR